MFSWKLADARTRPTSSDEIDNTTSNKFNATHSLNESSANKFSVLFLDLVQLQLTLTLPLKP